MTRSRAHSHRRRRADIVALVFPRSRLALLPAVMAVAVFLLLLGRRQIVTSHEARVAQTAREMAASGWPWKAEPIAVDRVQLVNRHGITRLAPDPGAPPMHVNPWVVPILTGEVRLQKPPLPYWCAAVLYRLFGTGEAMARLVPALLGALATIVLFDLTRLLYRRRIAWIAALVWVTTYLIPEDYRLAMADPYLAFFSLACVWAWVRAVQATRGQGDKATRGQGDKGTRGQREGGIEGQRSRGLGQQTFGQRGDVAGSRGRIASVTSVPVSPSPLVSLSPCPPVILHRPLNAFLLLFYFCLALGALAKAPLNFLHVAIPLALYHICFRKSVPGSVISHLLGILIFLAIALPWPIAVLNQVPNAIPLWQYESLGEISGANHEGVRVWWYYLVNLPQLALPWVALWLFSLIYPFRRKRATALFPFLWYAIAIVFFTAVGQKKLPYLLPMVPAQAIMIAVATAPLLRLAHRVRLRGWPGAIVAAQGIIGVVWALALPFMVWPFKPARMLALIVSAVAIVLALIPIRQMLSGRTQRWLVSQAISYAAIIFVFSNFVRTPTENARSPQSVCRELLTLADGTHRAILESKLPEEVAFYLPLHPPQGIAPREYLVVVVDDHIGVDERAKSHRPEPQVDPADFEGWVPGAKVVTVRRVPMESAPGDARWKVYELTVARKVFARSFDGRELVQPFLAPNDCGPSRVL
jgi:4-amino-4-deoxy-L-arabinose transferase-like glycosyltransferase